MNVAQLMLNAMGGSQYGPKAAWRSFLAVYFYTRSHHGAVIDDEGGTISFTRWYCFRCAVASAWEHLYRRKPLRHDIRGKP